MLLQSRSHHAYIAFFGSLILGSIYSRSKSIGPPILMHVIWNTTIAFVG
ncbi:MAG: CPBP family intramembrane metalloprotease [Crocinitomicaceae bacterium]|nr:CPBP family intramembrane metalloprotease [Crocinitomicaceae bacterium]